MKKFTFFLVVVLSTILFNISLNAQNGVIASFAGIGKNGFSGDGGSSLLAKLDSPKSIVFDKYENLYMIDGYRVRMVNTSGIITTIAGDGTRVFSGDGGPATAAQLEWPNSIAVDNIGNIYITDHNRIRMINSSGIINTIAGSSIGGYGGDGGPATAATFATPQSIAVDGIGNIYIADANNQRIRMINTGGIITTIAGTGISGFSGDGGLAIAAKLSYPTGITIDGSGNLFFVDLSNDRIRKVNTSGIISTFAGNGIAGFNGDGRLATLAELNYPRKVAVNMKGDVFIVDNGLIRRVNSSDGEIYTIAGRGSVIGNLGFAATAQIWASDIAFDSLGNMYLSEPNRYLIRKIQEMIYVNFYLDANHNCVMDTSDNNIQLPITVEVDSNGISIDTISTTSGFSYNTRGKIGDVYAFKIINNPAGLVVSCPTSGVIYDTITSLFGNYFIKNMGFQCITAGFDLGLQTTNVFTRGQHQASYIYAYNKTCAPINSTVTAEFKQQMQRYVNLAI